MKEQKKIEQRLQRLLKGRRIPVDDEKLKNIRHSLSVRVSKERHPLPEPGFFQNYRFAASLAVLFVMIGLLLWNFIPLHREEPLSSSSSFLTALAEDEEQLDYTLILLSGFASSNDQERSAVAWEAYYHSLLPDNEEASLLETFYYSEPS